MKEGRVLVVDDDPMVRETLGAVLRDEGYAVDVAIDGESALARVNATPPDAVLLDLMMPNMNGRQFLQALRDNPRHQGLPVLLMTAVHGVNIATLGPTEVIYKPFNVDELLNKVALAVYRSRDAEEGSPLVPRTLTPKAPSRRPSTPPPIGDERGVVLVVEQDRARLQQLDLALSARGFTVVSMTRSLVQLSRLARALRPKAILLDRRAEGLDVVLRELGAETALARIPLAVFSRGRDSSPALEVPGATMLAGAADADLLRFVEANS